LPILGRTYLCKSNS